MSDSNIYIEARAILCSYQNGKNRKRDVCFADELSIEEDKITFILGPSGSGKTSILQALGLMKKNFQGDINIKTNGQSKNYLNDLWPSRKELSERRRNEFSFIFQDNYLIPSYSVEENINLSLFLRDKSPSSEKIIAFKAHVHNLLSDLFYSGCTESYGVDVKKILNSNIHSLSVGQRQRVALAIALLKRPRILFADEPTGNLDFENAKHFMSKIEEEISDAKRPMKSAVIITHNEDIPNLVEGTSLYRFHCNSNKKRYELEKEA